MKNAYLLLFALWLGGGYVFAQSENPELSTDIANPPVKKDGTHLVNVDKDGVILRGYDAVAFHTERKPVKGNPAYQSTYEGAVYHFASAENKALFDQNPAKYAPQFGGFCAVAVALNRLSPIQLWTHSIVNGRLVFQHNKKALALWKKNVNGNLKKADKNWPNVNNKTKYD